MENKGRKKKKQKKEKQIVLRQFEKFKKFKIEMRCLQYFHSTFTTNFKWQVVTGYYWLLLLEQKSNLSLRFKFKPIITNHL